MRKGRRCLGRLINYFIDKRTLKKLRRINLLQGRSINLELASYLRLTKIS